MISIPPGETPSRHNRTARAQPPAAHRRRNSRPVGSGAVAAAAATGCCTTALLAERLLRAVDDGVRRPSPPDTRPVGVWVAAPLVSPRSERMDASSAVASRRSWQWSRSGPQHRGGGTSTRGKSPLQGGAAHGARAHQPGGHTTPREARRGAPHRGGHQHTQGGPSHPPTRPPHHHNHRHARGTLRSSPPTSVYPLISSKECLLGVRAQFGVVREFCRIPYHRALVVGSSTPLPPHLSTPSTLAGVCAVRAGPVWRSERIQSHPYLIPLPTAVASVRVHSTQMMILVYPRETPHHTRTASTAHNPHSGTPPPAQPPPPPQTRGTLRSSSPPHL